MNKFILDGEGRPMRLEYVADCTFFKTPMEHLCIKISEHSDTHIACYDFTAGIKGVYEKSLIVIPFDAEINLKSYTNGGWNYEYNN